MSRLLIETSVEEENESAAGYNHVLKIHEIDQLSQIVPSSQTEIEANDILDYVVDREQTLKKLVNSLRYGGRISFTGVDLLEVSRAITTGTVDIYTGSKFLYNNRLSTTSSYQLAHILQQAGLKVVKMRSNNYRYYLLALREAIQN